MNTKQLLKHTIVPFVMIVVTTLSAWGQDLNQLKQEFLRSYDAQDYVTANRLGEQLMALTPNMGSDTASVHLLYYIAYNYFSQGDYEKAKPIFTKVKGKLIELEENDGFLAYTYNSLGDCHYNQHNYSSAQEYYKQAIEIYKALPDKDDNQLATMLLNLADCYSSLRRIGKAKDPLSKVMRIYDTIHPIDYNGYTHHLIYFAEEFYKTGDYHYARGIFERAIPMYKQLPEKDYTELAFLQAMLGNCYLISYKHLNAITSYEQALQIIDSTAHDDNMWKAEVLSCLGDCYKNYSVDNHYEQALNYYLQALDIYDNHLKDNPNVLLQKNNSKFLAYTDLLSNIAQCYYSMGKQDDYIFYTSKINSLTGSDTQQEQNDHYTLSQLENNYLFFKQRTMDKLMNLSPRYKIMYGNAIVDQQATDSDNNDDTVYKLNKIAFFLSANGQFQKSIEVYSYIIEQYRNNTKPEDDTFSEALLGLGECYFMQHDYIRASQAYSEALQMYGNTITDLKEKWFNLAQCYYYEGMYGKAIDPYRNSLKCYENDTQLDADEKNEKTADIKCLLAKCYLHTEDYNKSIELFLATLNYYYQEEDIDVASAWDVLAGMAHCCFNTNDYDQALSLLQQIPHDSYKLEFLNALANLYYKHKDFGKASVLLLEAVDVFKKTENAGLHSFSTVELLSRLADCYSKEKNYSKVKELFFANMNEINDVDRDNHSDMAYASLFLFTLAKSYAQTGENSKASELYSQLTERLDSIKYGHIILPYVYLEMHDYRNALSSYRLSIDQSYRTMLDNMKASFTSRKHFWASNSAEFLAIYPNFVLLANDPSSVGDLYNKSALFSKGLLIATENELRNIIFDSGDSEAMSRYNKYRANRERITQLQEQAKTKEVVDEISFLTNENRELERVLSTTAMIYGNYMQNLQLTWNDVQQNLASDDIAVEFLSFPKFDSDSTIYIALTVRPGYPQPHLTVLCEEKELDAERAYTTSAMSGKIWKPLATELDGVRNIYFSPSGELHKIAIESMPHWVEKDSLMCNIYNIHRLSSTRELAMKRSNVEGNGTVLYGGIRYTCSIEDMAAAPKWGRHETKDRSMKYEVKSKKSDVSTQNSVVTNPDNLEKSSERYDTKAAGLRDDTTLEFLMESRVEVDNIEKVLGENVEKMTECDATEKSFKALSGKKKKNIHIATHGYYWNDSTARLLSKDHQLRALQQGADSQQEDKAMSLSGLFFGGAQINFSKDRKNLSDTIDDGVLTAMEVADLDLRGLDLVVLSACQTGLGDIVGSEGVFGLQRGFKKAGAQSIVMSLWPVDDEATKEFMVRFYQELKNNKTKRQAFNIAQEQLKTTYGNFEDKKHEKPTTRPHWAAFILLDADTSN